MAAVILYGALDFFLLTPSRKGPASGAAPIDLKRLSELSQQIEGEMESEALTEVQRYVKFRAGAEWESDPVPEKAAAAKIETPKTQETAAALPPMVYMGYIEAGKTRLAIIDGMEYGIGEQTPVSGATVWSIDADKVVLKLPGSEELVSLPFPGDGVR